MKTLPSGPVQRDSNLELLRIFAMLLIVAHHFSVHSGIFESLNGTVDHALTVNLYAAQVLASGGKLGVNIFVLISGYFLVKTVVRPSSLIKLWLSVYILNLALWAVLVPDLSAWNLKEVFLPVSGNVYWFITTYFVLMLFSPFLAIGLRVLSARQYRWLLIIGTAVLSRSIGHGIGGSSSDAAWFFLLFAFGGYMRLHLNTDRIRPWQLAAVAAVCLTYLFVKLYLYDLRIDDGARIGDRWFMPFKMTTVTVLALALICFIAFRKLRLGHNAFINGMSSCMLGVYIIHEHPAMRKWLWVDHLQVKEHLDLTYFVPWALLVILLVFLCCTFIEFLRGRLTARLYASLTAKLAPLDGRLKAGFAGNKG